MLAQIATDAKSNEITAVPQLLKLLSLQGTIVTVDALIDWLQERHRWPGREAIGKVTRTREAFLHLSRSFDTIRQFIRTSFLCRLPGNQASGRLFPGDRDAPGFDDKSLGYDQRNVSTTLRQPAKTLPPDILLLGARQSQEVKCFALGHAERSSPHSDTSLSAR